MKNRKGILLFCLLTLLLGATIFASRAELRRVWQQRYTPAPANARPTAHLAKSAAPVAPAQAGGSFNITQSVIAGGGERSSNGSNVIEGTLGQSATTQSSGGTYAIAGGFWPGAVPSQCPTISLTPATLPNGDPGVVYPNQTFTASGGGAPYTFSQTGTLPPGLTFTPATALLAGTPTTPGTFNFTIIATDANQCTGAQNYAVTINCPAITLNPATLPNGMVGTPYQTSQLTATGGTAPYSFQPINGSVPPGLTLTTGGLLSGTPTQVFGVNLEIRATDANGCTGTRTYNITITCATVTVGPLTLPNGNVGVPYQTTQLTATGGLAPHTFQPINGSVPPGLTLTPAGLLSGTPTQIFGVNLEIRATDANGCTGVRTYTITITCPTITVNPATLPNGMVGQAYSQNITQTGGVGAITFSLSAGTLPPGLSLNPGTGELSGTPTANGTSNFTVRATDANNCFGERAYSLIISECPTITVNPATLPNGFMGQSYNQTITATGGTAPHTFAVTAGALPNGVTLSTAGALAGTPVVAGSFDFTVTATDANNCIGLRAYSLLITNCPAITVNPVVLPNGFVGTAYNQTFTASGGTAPYTFSVSVGNLPNGLNLNTGTGALTGTPTTQTTFNFTIQATDANGCLGTRSYAVIISGDGLMFYPLARPIRLLDTRAGQLACFTPGAPIAGGTERTQPAQGICDSILIPTTARAITGNITPVNSGGGFLTLFPSDAARPLVASSNYGPNEITNNVFTVGLGPDGAFKIFAANTTEVVVDVTGYYAPPAAGGLFFHPLPRPVRLLETRAGLQGCFTPGAPLAGNASRTQMATGLCDGVTIPANAKAIVGNATVVFPQAVGFLTLFPADAAQPLVASGNYNAGDVVNTPFTVGLSPAGEFKIFTVATTHLVVDVLGYYSTDVIDSNGPGLLFSPLPKPVRLLETRAGQTGCTAPGAPLLANVEQTQQARGACQGETIPNTALSVVGTATVVFPAGPGFLTLWPNGVARPTVATLNYAPGQIVNRHFIVGLGADGMFRMFSPATTDLVIDLSGFFAP